jgi:hypothetical protein
MASPGVSLGRSMAKDGGSEVGDISVFVSTVKMILLAKGGFVLGVRGLCAVSLGWIALFEVR